MHSKHPEPPLAPPPVSSEPGAWITVSGVIALLLLFFTVSSILAYMGYYYFPQVGFGLLLSAAITKRSGENVVSNIGAAYLLLVLLLLGGIFTGYAGYELYRGLYEEEVRSLRELTDYIGVKGLVVFIFSNNAVLSLPSIIPYIGGVTLAAGTYNAGLILGLYSALGEISLVEAILILIAPHAVPEFLGYSLLLSASSRFGSWRKFTTLIVMGLLVLFSAAIIETALMISQEYRVPFTESLVEVVRELTS
jgi:phosphoglycerol transferase MdoB-like AlkP superfamily enzyme